MIKVSYEGVKPEQGSELAAGYDVRASEAVTIWPGTSSRIITSTSIQPPANCFSMLIARSGICNKNGLILLNSIGVIDPDYTGKLIFNFWNLSDSMVEVEAGERVGQIVFFNRLEAEFVESGFLDTKRGEGGFGSTGK